MIRNLQKRFSLGLNKVLNCSSRNEKEENILRLCWMTQLYGFIYMVIITTIKLIFQPHATLSLYFCSYLLITLLTGLWLMIIWKRHYVAVFTTGLTLNSIATFFFILKNGGLESSYGYLFIILCFVLLTILVHKQKIIIAFFSSFAILTALAVIIGPALKAPPEKLLSPLWNEIISVINIVSMMALAIFMVVYFIREQQKLEQREAIRQKDLSEAKTRLFTNITHEFRTPLTVIRGMASLIHQKPEQWIQEGTERIRENCDLILRLVNQLLDISKIEAKAMPVRLIQGNITAFTGFIIDLHRSAAIEKGITVTFTSDQEPVIADFDPDILAQILSNLIGNAIKFTDEQGKINITLNIDAPGNKYILKVADNGRGIPADKIIYVFDRFYQAGNHANSGGGTGLGLALAKELTLLLRGEISVESEIEKGSVFTVCLPVTHNAQKGEPFFGSFFNPSAIPTCADASVTDAPHRQSGINQPILLIVEDSKDVSLYLSAILRNKYHIELASNGKTGLEKAIALIPDIVLSDVMMPEMDGIELLDRLKNDFRTSHIPVVLLTAKADIDSRLAGLERGADAYITKPFNETELHIQLHNLIQLRKKLHERYASFDMKTQSSDPDFRAEDAFVVKVRDILEKNIGNEDFNVNDLCRELAVSHTQLYRKFKSISNLTIADYFKILRLQKARELLSASDLNITQIAFESGFKNLSHFSREFAQYYGISPLKMRKSNQVNSA